MSDQANFSVDINLGPAFRPSNVLDGDSLLVSLDKIKAANPTDPEEGGKVTEAVGMVIMALGYFYACGGTHDTLIQVMAEQLEKPEPTEAE